MSNTASSERRGSDYDKPNAAGELRGAAQNGEATLSARVPLSQLYRTNVLMQVEIEAGARALGDLFTRAMMGCCGGDDKALELARQHLLIAEMWAKRAIGRT